MRGREQLCSYETFSQFVGMFFNPICRLGHGLYIFQVHCVDLSENMVYVCTNQQFVKRIVWEASGRQSGVSATFLGRFCCSSLRRTSSFSPWRCFWFGSWWGWPDVHVGAQPEIPLRKIGGFWWRLVTSERKQAKVYSLLFCSIVGRCQLSSDKLKGC